MSDIKHESPTLRLRRLDAAAIELAELLREGRLSTLFQPIVDPRTRAICGFEALTRGPSNSWLHSPQNLFEAARRSGVKPEVDFACIQSAFNRFVSAGVTGQLFVNVSPETVYDEPMFAPRFLAFARAANVAIDRCVIELTEESLLDDYDRIRAILSTLREAGCRLAIDDLGAGFSGLRTWSELKPDYVKIDRYFITGIDSDPTKLEFVRSILNMGRAINCRVIAEGVETERECRELVELGVDRLQGHLFGRPTSSPNKAAQPTQFLDRSPGLQTASIAGQIAMPLDAVPPEMRVAEVVQLFQQRPECLMLPIVSDGKPLGVVRRDDLFALLAKPLHLEIYNKKAVTAVMEAPTLTVDAQLRLEQVSRLVTQKGRRRLTEEFVITKDGRYHGVGQTLDLLRHITEQQLNTARDCNPLSLLPGNSAIRSCIERLLEEEKRFVVCYFDLDAFKPYNDTYGFAQGDQVILHLAHLLKSCFSSRLDFVGHVGGDDFVVVARSADFRKRVNSVLEQFADTAPSFYRRESDDRERGYAYHPKCLSVSVAALDSETFGVVSADAVAELLSEIKTIAKQRPGNSFVFRSNDRLLDLLPPTHPLGAKSSIEAVGSDIDQALSA